MSKATSSVYDEAIARFINGAIDTADKVGQFAMSELPQFISDALQWYFVYTLILCVAGIALAVVLLVVDYKAFKAAYAYSKETGDVAMLLIVWGVIGMFARAIGWGIGVGNLFNLQRLKIWIAPKLWLIEYAARLMK